MHVSSRLLSAVNFTFRMETATIEQIHRVKHLQVRNVEKLPAIKKVHQLPSFRKLSRDQGLTQTCAFKEFRFEPPYVSKRKNRKKRKLPPIPEHMLPKLHNSFEEEVDEYDEAVNEMPTLPSISISPAFITERPDERSISVEMLAKSPHFHLFNTREFTFPESSSRRKKYQPSQPSQPSIVHAFTPRARDIPIQAKIEKLAKQKRRDRAKKAIERRYEKKLHNMTDLPSAMSHMAFKSKREPEVANTFHLKEHKLSPFKQMARNSEETEKSRLHPRLYTRIVDSIYSYTKGLHEHSRVTASQGSYERLMVTPVTTKDDIKGDSHSRQLTFLPPIV